MVDDEIKFTDKDILAFIKKPFVRTFLISMLVIFLAYLCFRIGTDYACSGGYQDSEYRCIAPSLKANISMNGTSDLPMTTTPTYDFQNRTKNYTEMG